MGTNLIHPFLGPEFAVAHRALVSTVVDFAVLDTGVKISSSFMGWKQTSSLPARVVNS
jgi:hypothetical protein